MGCVRAWDKTTSACLSTGQTSLLPLLEHATSTLRSRPLSCVSAFVCVHTGLQQIKAVLPIVLFYFVVFSKARYSCEEAVKGRGVGPCERCQVLRFRGDLPWSVQLELAFQAGLWMRKACPDNARHIHVCVNTVPFWICLHINNNVWNINKFFSGRKR